LFDANCDAGIDTRSFVWIHPHTGMGHRGTLGG